MHNLRGTTRTITWRSNPGWDRRVSRAVDFLRESGLEGASLGLVLGSGLGGFLDAADSQHSVEFGDIPGFFPASVAAHTGRVVEATVDGIRLLVLQGRLHAYEGLDLADVVLPVAVLERLGCEAVVLTNAAGGLRPGMRAGDLAILTDLIDLHGVDVARGILESGADRGGGAGVEVPPALFARAARAGALFDPQLSAVLEQAARRSGIVARRAVYASVWGPNYEESAMIGWLRRIGAEVVGMSTGPEAAYLAATGVRVAGLSCITNVALEHGADELSHEEVIDMGQARGGEFSGLLRAALPGILKVLARNSRGEG